MNILLICECDKRALVETRRILDQFAERRGERTWQTPITKDGLDTLRRLLRKTARKNTAVACHWIRGLDHSELLWVVGDARRFNAQGAVPTHTTQRNVLRAEDENDWHHLPAIGALTALAALLHDLGKATQAFQDRLHNSAARERNHYRHEWVSVRLFQAFVGTDDDVGWLQRLATASDAGVDAAAFEALWIDKGTRLFCDGLSDSGFSDEQKSERNPFKVLPPLAQAVAWLVLTHHRLPCRPVPNQTDASDEAQEDGGFAWRRFGARPKFLNRSHLDGLLEQVNADWNEPRESPHPANLSAYWDFPHGLPVRNSAWRKQVARFARKLQALSPGTVGTLWPADPFVAHIARLCLMLADHHYSSLGLQKPEQADSALRDKPVPERNAYLQPQAKLYANTTTNAVGKKVCNQTLDEHLLGVQAHACIIAHALPSLVRSLPTLPDHRSLKKRNTNARFQWQDKATDLAASVRYQAAQHGAFIVNMASTGCGKTLGNARIMNALADPKLGLRCAFAMGLRTLTLQTGRSFQRDLGLGDDQLAIKVGGAASRELFAYYEAQAEATGSASTQELLDEGGQVLFEGNDQHPLLMRLTSDAQTRLLLAAPLLVCTIDHLTPATESLRGGRQIAPMLRLMTGDLVLDEPDDFDMADLPALTRLVHWAGLLGARVLLSSATLPPALVEGLYLAYRDGRTHYQRHRGERPDEPPKLCCLWVDEFAQTHADCAGADEFRKAHIDFIQRRCAALTKAEVRRRAELVSLPPHWSGMKDKAARREEFAHFVLQRAWSLHQDAQNNSIDVATGKHVSFGLIRMANIDPLFDVALAMFRLGSPAANVRVHLCVYHSQFPLLTRSGIEYELDTVLNRRADKSAGQRASDPALQRPAVRALLALHPEQHHLFIVLGSPVTEVGRDHDYDWAVVEPSSMRSLIQLAGRVRRHRPGTVERTNMAVLDSNLRSLEQKNTDDDVFCKPGFEMKRLTPAKGLQPNELRDSSSHFHLQSHSLANLLPELAAQGGVIDARPRIAPRDKLQPKALWVDLEHARMRDTMLPRDTNSRFYTPVARDASLHWQVPGSLWLTGVLPQFQRFRYDPLPRVDVAWLPDDDAEVLTLHRVDDGVGPCEKLFVPIQSLVNPVPDAAVRGERITPWMQLDLLTALEQWAEQQDQPLRRSAEKIATASLPDQQQGWLWHPTLGFTNKN
ncbi:MAG: type I-F CRISPR-associated helicase Cas3f [Burkholderiaceae bacterium]|nr:type I-F CRISPR-associated helicase Cas3f [Burkholderiaceae bacterium]